MTEDIRSVPQVLRLRYGEFSDLVGGRDWDDLIADLERNGESARALQLRRACRLPPRHLFAEDTEGRQSLEILLVKVSAFGQVCRLAREREQASSLATGSELWRDAWIDLPGAGPVIPGFWSFSVQLPDPPDGSPENAGAPWFQLGRLLRRSVLGVDESGPEDASLFRPESLFYDPEGKVAWTVPAALWRRVLSLAERLGEATDGPDAVARFDDALREIEEIAVELRRVLFLDPPGADREILGVLSGLIDDPEWLTAVGAGAAPAEAVTAESPIRMEPRPGPSTDAEVLPPECEPMMEETLILGSSEGHPTEPEAPPPAPEEPGEPDRGSVAADTASDEDWPDSLEETLILRSEAKRTVVPSMRSARPPAPKAPPPAEDQGPENLEETIILRPGASKKQR